MKNPARLRRVSPALVVAMIALFVALTGTAVATTSVVTGDTAGGGPGGTALLVIYPTNAVSDGFVALYQPTNPAQRVVHFGEIVFRTDA